MLASSVGILAGSASALFHLSLDSATITRPAVPWLVYPFTGRLAAEPNSLSRLDEIIATLREPFLVLDKDLRVKTANSSFLQSFQVLKKADAIMESVNSYS